MGSSSASTRTSESKKRAKRMVSCSREWKGHLKRMVNCRRESTKWKVSAKRMMNCSRDSSKWKGRSISCKTKPIKLFESCDVANPVLKRKYSMSVCLYVVCVRYICMFCVDYVC